MYKAFSLTQLGEKQNLVGLREPSGRPNTGARRDTFSLVFFVSLDSSFLFLLSFTGLSLLSLFSFFLTYSLPLSNPFTYTFLLHLKLNPIKSFKAISPSFSPFHICLSSPFEFKSNPNLQGHLFFMAPLRLSPPYSHLHHSIKVLCV